MSYSLTTHSPFEGANLVINGTLGRLELSKFWSGNVGDYSDKASRPMMKIYDRTGEEITYKLPEGSAEGHGGSDTLLRNNLFRGYTDDPLGQMADLRAGMMSIGIGAAANISMAENRQVNLNEYYK